MALNADGCLTGRVSVNLRRLNRDETIINDTTDAERHGVVDNFIEKTIEIKIEAALKGFEDRMTKKIESISSEVNSLKTIIESFMNTMSQKDTIQPTQMNINRKITYPRYTKKSNFNLLTNTEVVARWTEAKSVLGMRFGGVALTRIEGTDHLGYAFVAGNDIPAELCSTHNTVMTIERILKDTEHNVQNAFYYYCDEKEVLNGQLWECGENIYPVFPKDLLLQLMANPVVADRPKIVMLTL